MYLENVKYSIFIFLFWWTLNNVKLTYPYEMEHLLFRAMVRWLWFKLALNKCAGRAKNFNSEQTLLPCILYDPPCNDCTYQHIEQIPIPNPNSINHMSKCFTVIRLVKLLLSYKTEQVRNYLQFVYLFYLRNFTQRRLIKTTIAQVI